MFMKPSGKVELLIISALLQPCHRSLQAKRPEVERRTSWLYLVFSRIFSWIK